MGSFEVWSLRVREALLWAGAGDAYATNAEVKQHDPTELVFDRALLGWKARLGIDEPPYDGLSHAKRRQLTCKEIIAGAAPYPALWDALMEVAANRANDMVDALRLGQWLARVKDRIAAEYDSNGRLVRRVKLVRAGEDRNKVALWAVRKI
jgi:hypothetical protein